MRWRDKRRRVQKGFVHASGPTVSERPCLSARNAIRRLAERKSDSDATRHLNLEGASDNLFLSPLLLTGL